MTNETEEILDKIMKEVLPEAQAIENLVSGRYKSLLTIPQILAMEEVEDEWIVDSIVLANGINVVSALPYHGKSLFTLLFAKAVATGKPFLGRFATKRGTVLVIDREVPTKRMKKRLTSAGITDMPIRFYDYDDPFKLDNKEDIAHLTQLIKDNDIKLVIIDTFNRVHKGIDITSSSEVMKLFEPLKNLLGITTFVLIHHSNKKGYKSTIPSPEELLGSTDLFAEIDVLYTLRQTERGKIDVHNLKAKGFELYPPFELAIKKDESGIIELQYLGEIETSAMPKETTARKIEQEILELLTSGKVKKEALIENLTAKGYKEGTINNTLTFLKRENLISSELIGNEAHYFLLQKDIIQDGDVS